MSSKTPVYSAFMYKKYIAFLLTKSNFKTNVRKYIISEDLKLYSMEL